MLLEFMQTFQQFLDMEEPYEDGYTLGMLCCVDMSVCLSVSVVVVCVLIQQS